MQHISERDAPVTRLLHSGSTQQQHADEVGGMPVDHVYQGYLGGCSGQNSGSIGASRKLAFRGEYENSLKVEKGIRDR